MPRSGALALALAVLAACAPHGRTPGAEERWRGRAVRDGETVALAPCGGTETLTLASVPRELIEAFQVLPEASSPLWIEVRGVQDGDRLRVTSLRRASGHADLCREDASSWAYRATGNEPFWAATLASRGIVLTGAGQVPAVFPLPAPSVEGSRRTYAAASRTVPGDRIEVVLEEVPCLDGMSGDLFPFRADVRRGGRTLRGCAAEGLPR